MRLRKRIGVVGCAIRAPVADDAQSLEELLFDVGQEALQACGLQMARKGGVPSDRVLDAIRLAKLLRHGKESERRRFGKHCAPPRRTGMSRQNR
jgi:hypothetical protein